MDKVQPVVLIVDDEPSVRRMLKEMFTSEDMTVITANDTTTALELLTANQPDLIVTDLMLPQVGGAAFIQQVRTIERFSKTPIIVLSGFTSGLGPTARAAGATLLLRKPDDILTLVESAKKLIEKGEEEVEKGDPSNTIS